MTFTEFTQLLSQPASITEEQTRELEHVLVKAPYFQTARALRLKGLKAFQGFRYNSVLKKTAAYTTDRDVLFDYITSPEFSQDIISREIREQEARQIRNIEVHQPEEVIGRRSIAIDEAIKMKRSESERVLDPGLFERRVPENPAPGTPLEEKNSPAEHSLGLGDPLEFDSGESHSFSEWLRLTSAKPVRREGPADKSNPNFELIDKFISSNPKIRPGKTTSKNNLAERHMVAPEALMTETLARVYLEQKNYKKAIKAYEILILKNPEKSGFFADQIRAIEQLQENNKH